MLGTYHATSLFTILNDIHFIYEPAKLWQFVLEKACATVQAEAGTFFELSENGEELHATACFGVDATRLNSAPFRIGKGICGWVAQQMQPSLVNDVRKEPRFNGVVDMVTGFTTKSILCVPLIGAKRLYGVLEILNRKNGPFSLQDQEFMTLLGKQTAIAYQNLKFVQEITKARILLESVVRSMSGGMIAADGEARVMLFNPAAARILNLPEGKPFVGQTVATALKDFPWFAETLAQTFSKRETVSRQETKLTIANRDTTIGYSTIVIADEDSRILGSAVVFQKLSA